MKTKPYFVIVSTYRGLEITVKGSSTPHRFNYFESFSEAKKALIADLKQQIAWKRENLLAVTKLKEEQVRRRS